MTQEKTQDNVQETQENVEQNEQGSPSDSGLLQEIMAKKSKIKEQSEIIAKYEAQEEKRRTQKLEDDGKLKELITELQTVNKKQTDELNSANEIVSLHKQDLINSITTDESEKEDLSKESIKTLRFLQSKLKTTQTINNPTASLNAVRDNSVKSDMDFSKMTATEKNENWDNIVNSFRTKK
tara:strand:- start:67 stop:609 length:543 start_codon:yes stop_codon:yes gene_type:complete